MVCLRPAGATQLIFPSCAATMRATDVGQKQTSSLVLIEAISPRPAPEPGANVLL